MDYIYLHKVLHILRIQMMKYDALRVHYKIYRLIMSINIILVPSKFSSFVEGPVMSFIEGTICPHASQTCCDRPRLFGMDIPTSNFLFILRSGDGGDGLDNRWIRLGSTSEGKVSSMGEFQYLRLGSSSEKRVLSSVVVSGVSQPSLVLKFMGGVEIGDGSDGTGDWGYNSRHVHLL